MDTTVFRTLALATILGVAPLGGIAQDGDLSARHHPWGRFEPGAWKTVRVVTETLDERGRVVSVCTADTKTTLLDIDADGVTLETRACMEVAGKRFEAELQTVRQGFHGEPLGPNLKIDRPADAVLTIEGRKIPCKVLRIESVVPNGKTATTLDYSFAVAPFVLKRETVTTDPEGKNVLCETKVDVISLSAPLKAKVRGESRVGVRIKTKTVRATDGGSVITWNDFLPEAPGGIVGGNSEEFDKAGKLIRRSALELVDFSAEPDHDRGLFGRKRNSRHRAKTPPRYEP